jgi:MFS family permease
MQTSALAWLVFRLTGSEELLGVLAFGRGAASCVTVLLAGAFLDRLDRRSVVIATQALALAQAAALAILSAAGALSVPAIMALSILLGLIDGVDMPARQSLVGEMSPPEDLASALALSSSSFNAARVVGFSIGGLIIGWVGETACFTANTVSFLAVLVALLAMRRAARPVSSRAASIVGEIRAGLAYARSTPHLRVLLPLITLGSLATGYFPLLPSLAVERLGQAAAGYGALGAAAGLGSIAAAAVIARASGGVGGRRVIAGCALFGAALVALAASPIFALAWLSLILVGFGMTTMYTSANTYLQIRTPESVRGRVMSLYIMTFTVAQLLAALLLGWIAARLGAALAVGGCGVLVMLSALSFARYPLEPASPGAAASGGEA